MLPRYLKGAMQSTPVNRDRSLNIAKDVQNRHIAVSDNWCSPAPTDKIDTWSTWTNQYFKPKAAAARPTPADSSQTIRAGFAFRQANASCTSAPTGRSASLGT